MAKSIFSIILFLSVFSKTFANDSLISPLTGLKSKHEVENRLKLLWNYRTEGKFRQAIDLGLSLIPVCEKKGMEKLLAENYFRLANVYHDIAQYDSALFFAQKSLSINSTLNVDIQIANCYSIIAAVYYSQSLYNNALEYYLMSLSIKEKKKNEKGLALLYNNIGNIYKDLEDFGKSYNYRVRSLVLFQKAGNSLNEAIIKTNLAFDLTNMPDTLLPIIGLAPNQRDATIKTYYREALLAFEKNQMPMGVAAVMGNLGLWYHKTGNYDTALVYEKKCLEIYTQLDMPSEMSAALGDLALVYNSLFLFNESIKAGSKAKLLAEKTGNRVALAEIYKNLYISYKAVNNETEALFHLEKWKMTSDSLKGEEENKAITRKTLQYEFNKKSYTDSLKVAELRKMDTIINERKISEQRMYYYAALLGFLIMLIVAYILIKANKQKQKNNSIIKRQKELVEEKQREIIDSITYAKRLQEAILPPVHNIRQLFKDSFVSYLPKDIVAGDFYWMEELEDTVFIAAADCTGHGVPGAMVSVVCSNALNRAVKEFGFRDTGKILDKVTELVLETFEKSGEDVRDGMDISLLRINRTELENSVEVQWSGANNPLWYIHCPEKNMALAEIIKIKADKQPIGKYENRRTFKSHSLKVKSGTIFYLFTDGLPDQFGGPKGKKFMYRKFEENLLSVYNLPMTQQQELLETAFAEWKGNLDQVDDITIIGIKL